METTSDKVMGALKILLRTELGIELSQDEALILTNTLVDFLEVLALIEHKKDCPKKKELEIFLKEKWGGKRKINMTMDHHDDHN